jgi:hypothetical protein
MTRHDPGTTTRTVKLNPSKHSDPIAQTIFHRRGRAANESIAPLHALVQELHLDASTASSPSFTPDL